MCIKAGESSDDPEVLEDRILNVIRPYTQHDSIQVRERAEKKAVAKLHLHLMCLHHYGGRVA